MFITKDLYNQKVSKDMLPTRLDSALNLLTNIYSKDRNGIVVYNINHETWNCLYAFYEMNHKFTIDDYHFNNENPTYGELIEEYKSMYHEIYEQEKGYNKGKRMQVLSDEFKRTFGLNDVTIGGELEPVFELKYSKSKNVWTLYYFENYVASKVDRIEVLLKQKLYDQKFLPLDASIHEVDGVEVVSNIPFSLSSEANLEILNNNRIVI